MIETVVAVGMILMICAFAWIPRAGAARVVIGREAFDAMRERAIALAAVNDGEGSGAVVSVAVRDGISTITLLRNRPIPGKAAPTVAAPPERIDAVVRADGTSEEGFALAYGPAGALDLLTRPLASGAPPILRAPGCGAGSAVRVTISTRAASVKLVVPCRAPTAD